MDASAGASASAGDGGGSDATSYFVNALFALGGRQRDNDEIAYVTTSR